METPEFYEVVDGKLRVHPHKGQYRALNSKARTILVLAGTQGGKTVTGPLWMLNEMKAKGPGDYMVATPTYPLLELKALPEFRMLFEERLNLGKYVGSPSRQFRLSDHGQQRLFGESGLDYKTNVFFGYAADPDSLEAATAKACWSDEAGQKKFKLAAWQAIQRRLSVNQGRNYVTTTPYSLGWLKQELHDKSDGYPSKQQDIELVRFESIANPRFPRAEWERAKNTMPLWKFDLFYKAKFTRPAGLIYDCIDEHDYVPRFTIPGKWPRLLGLDFGGVHTAALFYAESPNGNLYLYREYLAGGLTASEHARALLKGEPDIPDCVGGSKSEQQWRDEFRAAGLPVREPDITEVEVGIDRVYAAHKQHKIKIFDDLTGYRDQLESYSRELDEFDMPTEKIENKEDYHFMDAERYPVSWKMGGSDWVMS